MAFPKPKGLSELAKLDWQRRLDNLTDLKGRELISHEIIDGKVDKKVPVAQVIERAISRGLVAAEEEGRLHIARRPKPSGKKKETECVGGG